MVGDGPGSGRLKTADETVHRLRSEVASGRHNADAITALMQQVLDGEYWREYSSVKTGEPVHHESFQEFVRSGLGFRDVDPIVAWIQPKSKDVAERVERAWREEIAPVAKHGGDRRSPKAKDNQDHDMNLIHPESNDGILARLKRDDPGMAQQVIDGQLTANAAARMKGWRKPRILLTSPDSVAKRIREHYTPEEISELIEHLGGETA